MNLVVDHPRVAAAGGGMARPYRVELVRQALARLRGEDGSGVPGAAADRDGSAPGTGAVGGDALEELVGEVESRIRDLLDPGPHPVANATGVPLHTNLGRAPLGPRVMAAIAAAGGYTDLELDLATGERGDRHARVSEILALLCGTEAGLVVNNNAAAVLLVASALAAGGEIVVSRGELVEIGGSFRIPDVVAASGARLVEVGTTNRTRAGDYREAVGPATRVLLKVHRSNFRVEGFTEEPSREDLSEVARATGLPLVEDLGSGCLVELGSFGLTPEPTPGAVLSAGVDLVTFSGDKLLGGMQAGLIAGRRELVAKLAKHPLLRALRLDKIRMAGVLACLADYLVEGPLAARIPVLAMLAAEGGALRAAAEDLAGRLAGGSDGVDVVEVSAPVGGGSCPGDELPGFGVAIRPARGSAAALARRLRTGRLPVLCRVEGERVLLDPRTLGADLAAVAGSVRRALGLDPGQG